jgi:hypothetical protein
MKALKIVAAAAAFLLGLSAAAQNDNYLFDEFTDGTVLLKNRSVVKTKFNLDIYHDKFLYKDGDQTMEMTDFSNVASVYIGDRTFVPQGKYLYEVLELNADNNLLVKWHRKKNALGKAGAYGQIAHASSTESLDPEYYSPSLTKRGGKEETTTVSENKYGILSGGKFRTFTDKRSFLKLFPEKKAALEAFINEHRTFFSDVEDVVALAKFAVEN